MMIVMMKRFEIMIMVIICNDALLQTQNSVYEIVSDVNSRSIFFMKTYLDEYIGIHLDLHNNIYMYLETRKSI